MKTAKTAKLGEFCPSKLFMYMVSHVIPYNGLIWRGEIFMDWIVKTFYGYIFEEHITK